MEEALPLQSRRRRGYLSFSPPFKLVEEEKKIENNLKKLEKEFEEYKAKHIVTVTEIDFIKELILSRCPDCKKKLKGKTTIRHRYVTDIKLISSPTRYDIHRYYCTSCKKIVEQEVPNALPHARFGLGIVLLVMYLLLGLRMPEKKVCEYFKNLYSLHISEGEIVCILRQLAVNMAGCQPENTI